MFIVEQRPWLGIWLTICFSGIQGEATKRMGERCLDYATNGLACWAGEWIGWIKVKDDYVRRCWVFMTRRDNTHLEGDTRTHILHFKENPLFSPAFVCATKKNQNKIVSTCLCRGVYYKQTRLGRPILLCFWLYTLWTIQDRSMFDPFFYIPVNKDGRTDTSVWATT